MGDTNAVLSMRIRTLEREIKEIKKDLKDIDNASDDLNLFKETTLLKLIEINRKLESIQTSVSKDEGWRGFILDFIKAAAQIAVMVGAGKWIF